MSQDTLFEKIAAEIVDRIYVMFIDDQQLVDGKTTEEQKIAIVLKIMRPLRARLSESEGGKRCSWCNTDPVEAASRHEGPHATWCVHHRTLAAPPPPGVEGRGDEQATPRGDGGEIQDNTMANAYAEISRLRREEPEEYARISATTPAATDGFVRVPLLTVGESPQKNAAFDAWYATIKKELPHNKDGTHSGTYYVALMEGIAAYLAAAPQSGKKGDGWIDQREVYEWAVRTFGEYATRKDERAMRLVEEAVELAQAIGVPQPLIERIIDRVYSRPPGEVSQELGGSAVTLLALAECLGLSAHGEARREFDRVLNLPADHFRRKVAEKIAAGVENIAPSSPQGGAVTSLILYVIGSLCFLVGSLLLILEKLK